MKRINYITPFVFAVASVQLLMSMSARANVDLIKKLDLDEDGQITIKESISEPSILASFGKIDTNGDGKISSIELQSVVAAQLDEKTISQSE